MKKEVNPLNIDRSGEIVKVDVKELNDEIDRVLNSNDSFMRDEDKKWRKGKILIDEKLERIKYKFHGTAVTPIRKGGFSLRIKHKKDSNYKHCESNR